MRKRRVLLIAAAAAALGACHANDSEAGQTGTSETQVTRPVRIIVMDCYSTDVGLAISVDGQDLPLSPPGERNDSLGLCFDAERPSGAKIAVEVRSERLVHRSKVTRQDGKVLLISGTRPAEQAGFVDASKLAFD